VVEGVECDETCGIIDKRLTARDISLIKENESTLMRKSCSGKSWILLSGGESGNKYIEGKDGGEYTYDLNLQMPQQ
jgi:hypothetical protein